MHTCSTFVQVNALYYSYVMAGNRGQYYTVSEALQAVLDESDMEGEEHVWEDDDALDSAPTTVATTLSLASLLSPIPTNLQATLNSPAGEISLPCSSTPSTGRSSSLSLPMSKRQRLGDSSTSDSDLSASEDDGESGLEVAYNDPSATLLAEQYFSTNPAIELDHEAVTNEPATIEYVHAKVLKGCSCSRKCFERLSANPEEIFIHRLNVTEMSKAERDMLVMANINAGMHAAEKSTCKRINYRYHNFEVCVDTFVFLHAISLKYLKTIRSWYLQNGLVPCVHGNTGRRPTHAFNHEVIKAVVQFIKVYKEVHGMPQPAAPRGRADTPPTYLPASQNFKTVHSQYVCACTSTGSTHVGYSVFKSVAPVYASCSFHDTEN